MAHHRRPMIRRDDRKNSAQDIAQRYFPKLDRRSIHGKIMCGLTGWPCFWLTTRILPTGLDVFRDQLCDAASRLRRGISIDQQLFTAWCAPLLNSLRDDAVQKTKGD